MTPETATPRFIVLVRSTGPFGTEPTAFRPTPEVFFSHTAAYYHAMGFRLTNVPAIVQEVR